MEFFSAIGLLPVLIVLFEHENRLHVKFDWTSIVVCGASITPQCPQIAFVKVFLDNWFNSFELSSLVGSCVQPV